MNQEVVNQETVIESVKRWLQSTVVDLNLCPFAGVPLLEGTVRFVVIQDHSVDMLLHRLQAELELLSQDRDIETTLLVHPQVLVDFFDYNQFLTLAENLLVELGYEGVYQIASFHPHYQFAGTRAEDAENFSNRSPYPMLHLLREESVEGAIAAYGSPEKIPERNIERLNGLGSVRLQKMLNDCYGDES